MQRLSLGIQGWGEHHDQLGPEAHNARIMTSWLAHELRQAVETHPTQRMSLATQCLHSLHMWHAQVEESDRYLRQEDPGLVFRICFLLINL